MTDQEIRTLKASGKTYAEIGKLIGVSRQRVQQRLRVKTEPPERCHICGNSGKLHAHHLDYLSGDHIWLCISCHRTKHTNMQDVVSEPEHPATIKCPHCCGSGTVANPAREAQLNRMKRYRSGLDVKTTAAGMGIAASSLWALEKGYRNWTPLNQSRFDAFLQQTNNTKGKK